MRVPISALKPYATLLAFVSCGGAVVEGSMPPERPAPTEGMDEQLDRCRWLPPECFPGFDPMMDVGGCPDPPPPEIAFSAGSAALPKSAAKLLDDIARDAKAMLEGSRLVIQAESAPSDPPKLDRRRRNAVIRALRARGVPENRVIAVDGPIDQPQGDPEPNRVVITTEGCQT